MLKHYLDIIVDYNIGLEGSSCWIWYKDREGIWKSYGVAKDTIEESLEDMKSFIDCFLIKEGGVNEER